MRTSLSGAAAFTIQGVTAAGGNTAFGFQSQLRHFWPTSALSPSRKRFQGERERHQEFDFGVVALGQEPRPLLIIPQGRNVQVKPAAVKALLSAELSCLCRRNLGPQVEQCWALHPLAAVIHRQAMLAPTLAGTLLGGTHVRNDHLQSHGLSRSKVSLCQKSEWDEVRYHKSNGSSYHPRDQAACTGFR